MDVTKDADVKQSLKNAVAPCTACGKRTLPEYACPYCGAPVSAPDEDDEPPSKTPPER